MSGGFTLMYLNNGLIHQAALSTTLRGCHPLTCSYVVIMHFDDFAASWRRYYIG